MQHTHGGTNGRIKRQLIAVLAVLAIVGVAIAAAAAFTPTATLNDDGELSGATTQTNVSVVGSGSDAVLEKVQSDGAGTYESQNLTVEHAPDREEIHVDAADVYGGNITVSALRLNTTASAWETAAEKETDTNGTHILDISGNDTVKYRFKVTFESGAHANVSALAIGGQDTKEFSYTKATDDATAFGNAVLEDGATLETGADSVDETALINMDSANYSTYTGPSYVVDAESDREAVGVELSNVSTDVLIAAEYQDADGNWVEATNATVVSEGTHPLNISKWSDQSKWRVVVQNDPGGHAAITREGIGSSPSEVLGGGGGASGGFSLGEWWDGLNPGTQGIVILVLGVVMYGGARKYDLLEG